MSSSRKSDVVVPSYPSSLPKYIGEGLQKQDVATLETVRSYVDQLINWLEEPPSDSELTGNGRQLSTQQRDGYTRVVKRIPCGKDCGGCPHGPYEYHVRRTSSKLDWEYIGRVSDISETHNEEV
jgi:hypothetical protein